MEPASPDPAASLPAANIRPRGRVNLTGIRIGYALGGLAWLTCFLVASELGRAADSSAVWINVLICLFGSIVGWWVGFLMSPDPTEQGQFSSFRKAASAFLSGFVLAKIDILFQGAVAENLTNTPLFMGRIGLFTTTAMICAQFTYVARHDLGMYGVGHYAPEGITDTPIAPVQTSRGQHWLRIAGLILALAGIGLFSYLSGLRSLEPIQQLTILFIALSVLVFLGSTATVREWFLGKRA